MYTNEETASKQCAGTGEESLRKVKIWKSKIINKIVIEVKRNKYLIATLGAFLIFSTVNAMMICTFFKLMLNIYK